MERMGKKGDINQRAKGAFLYYIKNQVGTEITRRQHITRVHVLCLAIQAPFASSELLQQVP